MTTNPKRPNFIYIVADDLGFAARLAEFKQAVKAFHPARP